MSLWHESFYECVTERAPPGFDILTEFSLSRRPRRADLLLLRRKTEPRCDGDARILRGLWPYLGDVTLVEFKSPARGMRRSELLRLFSYGLQYHEQHMDSLPHRNGLGLALVTPCPDSALAIDLAAMDCRLHFLGNGYAQVHGFVYDTFIAFTDEVSQTEKDDFLRIFSHHAVQTPQARHWLEQWITEKETMPNARKQAGHDEILAKLIRSMPLEDLLRLIDSKALLAGLDAKERLAGLDAKERLAGLDAKERLAGLDAKERLAGLDAKERLAGLDAKERLAGLAAEERLAGLDPADVFLALPVEMLHGFSDEYIATLPENTQQTIRKRLRRANSPRRRSR